VEVKSKHFRSLPFWLVFIFLVVVLSAFAYGKYYSRSFVPLPSVAQIDINIPPALTGLGKNLISPDYSLEAYYYSEDENSFTLSLRAGSHERENLNIHMLGSLHTDSTVPKYSADADIILYKNKTLADFENSALYKKEFDIAGYHFVEVGTDRWKSDLDTECVTRQPQGLITIAWSSNLGAVWKDCESYLRQVLTDNYTYPGEFVFTESRPLYSALTQNLSSCQRIKIDFSNNDPPKAHDDFTVDYVCSGNPLHISYYPSGRLQEKTDCCLVTENLPDSEHTLRKIDGVNTCKSKVLWTGQMYANEYHINLRNYFVQVDANSDNIPLGAIVASFNSPDMGYRKVNRCTQPFMPI
jgi:hypothetical protein